MKSISLCRNTYRFCFVFGQT